MALGSPGHEIPAGQNVFGITQADTQRGIPGLAYTPPSVASPTMLTGQPALQGGAPKPISGAPGAATPGELQPLMLPSGILGNKDRLGQ